VNMASLDDSAKVVRFLIDDVAFIETDCVQAQDDMRAELVEAGAKPFAVPPPVN